MHTSTSNAQQYTQHTALPAKHCKGRPSIHVSDQQCTHSTAVHATQQYAPTTAVHTRRQQCTHSKEVQARRAKQGKVEHHTAQTHSPSRSPQVSTALVNSTVGRLGYTCRKPTKTRHIDARKQSANPTQVRARDIKKPSRQQNRSRNSADDTPSHDKSAQAPRKRNPCRNRRRQARRAKQGRQTQIHN